MNKQQTTSKASIFAEQATVNFQRLKTVGKRALFFGK